MPSTPQDRLKAKQPRRITVGIYLDESAGDRYDAAVLARQEARREVADGDELAELDRIVREAEAALDEATQWWTFAALGRSAFARLLAEHPPTAEDLAEAEAAGRDAPQWGDTFVPDLVHASLLSPVLTLQDVQALWAPGTVWNDAELGALFAAALGVNTRARPLRVRQGT